MRDMSDTTKQLCEMAEWFKEQGDMETYLSVKRTTNKLLDFILYTSYQPNSEARRRAEIARLQTRSGCIRGALKPNRGERSE